MYAYHNAYYHNVYYHYVYHHNVSHNVYYHLNSLRFDNNTTHQ